MKNKSYAAGNHIREPFSKWCNISLGSMGHDLISKIYTLASHFLNINVILNGHCDMKLFYKNKAEI